MAEQDGPKLVTLEILAPIRAPSGARWAPPDRAGFLSTEADDLIRRGLARKAPTVAPVDRMVKENQTVRK